MSNYKAEAVAAEIADELARRTGLAVTWAPLSGVPTVYVGATNIKTGGGVVIQVQDQRAEGNAGWGALPGFMAQASSPQPVFTTGVAKVINESQVDVSAALAYASGTLTIGGGADSPLSNDDTVVINGITLTAKAVPVGENQFVTGATDNAGATNLAAAINAHSILKNLVTAVATPGTPNSTVVITAKVGGAAGNAITTTETSGTAAWGGVVLSGGAGGGQSMVTPLTTFTKIWAAIAKRGLKMEFYQTALGTAPINSGTGALNTNYFIGEFFPNEFWPLSGLV